MFIVYNSIGYLTNKIDYKKPIRLNEVLYIQTQSNINKMYEIMKKHEKNIPVIQDKPDKKKISDEDFEKEIMQDKLNIFNEITL